MYEPVVLSIVARLLLPAILMFSLYVQAHGEVSAGGGFQAGVIFATGIVAFTLVQGIQRGRQLLPVVWLERGMALGLLLYVGVGFVTMLLGGNFLDYAVLRAVPASGRHLGIFLVELGIGITVAAVMITVFFTIANVDREGQTKRER